MSMIKTFGALAVASLLLTGCLGGGGGSSSGANNQDGDGEQPGVTVSFTTLVKDIFADTSDTAEPVPINGLAITYDDQENQDAFDDLLSQQ